MPEEQAPNPVRVIDRRRFQDDGEPRPEEGVGQGGGAVPAPERAPETPADPRDAQLAAQSARIDELTRAYAKLVEDNKAFRSRLEREQARVLEAERVNVVQALLEALDELERAFSAVTGAGAGEGLAGSLKEGVRLTLDLLNRKVAALGAERIETEGKPFDPQTAEAIDAVPVMDAEQDGRVLSEIRSGYRMGGRVLRPARVRVGRLARA
jgi:molecular chaperone GrpE